MSAEQIMNMTETEKLEYISKQSVEEPKLCNALDEGCSSCQ